MKLSLIAEADINRRQFMKQATGMGIAAATRANPMLAAAHGALSAGRTINVFLMTDEQLLHTPEYKWIDKVGPARVARIARDYPEHGKREACHKVVKILTYGILHHGAGWDPGSAHAASDVAANASKSLQEISQYWKLSQKELMDLAQQWHVFDYGMLDDEQAITPKAFADFLRQNAGRYNLRRDLMGQHETETPEYQEQQRQRHEAMRQRQEKQHQQRQHERRQRKLEDDYDEHALARFADEGNPNFESRLSRALGLIT